MVLAVFLPLPEDEEFRLLRLRGVDEADWALEPELLELLGAERQTGAKCPFLPQR